MSTTGPGYRSQWRIFAPFEDGPDGRWWAADLNDANDLYGRGFETVEEAAAYIAEMLVAEANERRERGAARKDEESDHR